jgi:hypothetical protein
MGMPTTITSATYYTASAKAVRTRQDSVLKHEIGEEITVTAGSWLGSGEKYPSWSEHGPEKFNTLEALQNYVAGLSLKTHGFDVVPNTVEFFKVETVTHTTHEMVKIDV